DAKGWLAGLIAAGTTVALYLAIFWPLQSTPFGELFLDRGVIPYFITLFACWGGAILLLKYLAVRKQLGYADMELELELIPLEIGMQVTTENVDQFLGHIGSLPDSQRKSIMGRRIGGALEHFKHRTSVPEVQEYLSSQAEIDGSGVDSGYTLLRAFIWAIPILGFIGTVMGISTAVTGLSDTMPSASDKSGADKKSGADSAAANMMKGMGTVTSGLPTAFDTTMLALVMAILLLFPTEWLRKTEYRMLDRIEEFANESLLRRMSDKNQLSGEAPEIVRDALEGAFQEHQKWLAQWQAQVGELGQVIGGEFEAAVLGMQDKIAESEKQRFSEVQNSAEIVREMFEQFGQATVSWQRSSDEARRNIEASLKAASNLQSVVAENGRQIAAVVEKQSQIAAVQADDGMRDEIKNLTEQIKNDGLRDEVRQLRDVVAGNNVSEEIQKLRDDVQQIKVDGKSPPPLVSGLELEPLEMESAPAANRNEKKHGLFGFFRGRNTKSD
ncbi:MAG: MotA/TolQ/ExbB proton channel family protein, partial [Planctomycetes bacterium]|nr:MotA/TolQ/ExbB proton channel family protein [Planctomycetota bacterium]